MQGENKCSAGGKRGFASKAAAVRASKGVSNRIRVYRCPECHRYHITSEAEGHRQSR